MLPIAQANQDELNNLAAFKRKPTDKMVSTMSKIIGALGAFYRIELSRETIKGHREHIGSSTICPGGLVIDCMDEIVEKANEQKTKIEK